MINQLMPNSDGPSERQEKSSLERGLVDDAASFQRRPSTPQEEEDIGTLENGSPQYSRVPHAEPASFDYVDSPSRKHHVTSEKPKNAKSHRLSTLFKLLPVHIIALGMTAAVIRPTFANYYWFDEGSWTDATYSTSWIHHFGQNEVMNALQYAAKLHEILMVSSLSLLSMDFWRRRLLGKNGIALGLLGTGYSSTAIETVFQKSTWSSVTRSWRDRLSVLFLVVTVIMANVVGPSSAIAIIPNLDWWVISDPFHGPPISAYITLPSDELYPTHLTRLNASADDRDIWDICYTANYSTTCPGAAFDDLYKWANAYAFQNVSSNITMTEPLGATRRVLLTANNKGKAITSTLHQSVTLLTGLFWRYINSESRATGYTTIERPLLVFIGPSQISAPVVRVQCNYFDFDSVLPYNASSPALNVTYPYEGGDRNLQVDPDLYDYSYPKEATNFTFTDLSKNASGISLGAFATVPWLYTLGDINETEYQGSVLLPCSIEAQWAPANLTFDPTTSDLVSSNFSKLDGGEHMDESEYLALLLAGSTLITIDPSWAGMLDVPGVHGTSEGGEQLETTMMQALLNLFVANTTLDDGTPVRLFDTPWGNVTAGPSFDEWGSFIAQTVSILISSAVTEGLSRSAYRRSMSIIALPPSNDTANVTVIDMTRGLGDNLTYTFSADNMKTVLENSTQFDFAFYRYGYGYGWNYSTTVQLSLGVLLIHASIALGYIIYSFAFWTFGPCKGRGRGWVSTAWGDPTELVALALVSPDPNCRKILGDVGAGIHQASTWNQTVRIREGPNSQLHLVVGDLDDVEDDDRNLRDVKTGKKYR